MSEPARTLVDRYALPPPEVETASLQRVDEVLRRVAAWNDEERQVVARMAYAAGDLSVVLLVRLHPRVVADAVSALRRGRPVVTDVRAVEVSLDHRRLAAAGCPVHCGVDAQLVERQAEAQNLPRAVLAMRSLAAQLQDGIAVIGTAPTALLALLDLVDEGLARPALIVATPVGFVAASEAKAELMARDVPYITIEGSRGGAALAAAAANALLRLAVPKPAAAEPGA